MKVTQYQTVKNFNLRPYVLKPIGGKMGGAETVVVSENPVNTDFRGFGVAVTGSSCYNLSLMDEQKRAEFLKDISVTMAWDFLSRGCQSLRVIIPLSFTPTTIHRAMYRLRTSRSNAMTNISFR